MSSLSFSPFFLWCPSPITIELIRDLDHKTEIATKKMKYMYVCMTHDSSWSLIYKHVSHFVSFGKQFIFIQIFGLNAQLCSIHSVDHSWNTFETFWNIFPLSLPSILRILYLHSVISSCRLFFFKFLSVIEFIFLHLTFIVHNLNSILKFSTL